MLEAPEKPCKYGGEPGQQVKQGPCEYDSESERQESRNTCEYDSESGRQVLSEWQETTSGISSRTPSVTPQEDEVEADHLIARVSMQTITRRRARQAVLNEAPWQEPSEGLRQLIAIAQKEDPFYRRVDKDLSKGDSTRPHYGRTGDGILLYKGRMVVPNQRSLVYELIELHHDERSAGH